MFDLFDEEITTREEKLDENVLDDFINTRTVTSTEGKTKTKKPPSNVVQSIYHANSVIRKFLLARDISEQRRQYHIKKWIAENGEPMDQPLAEEMLPGLIDQINDYICSFEIGYFYLMTIPIIEEYDSLSTDNSDFFEDTIDINAAKKHQLTQQFMVISRLFINLKLKAPRRIYCKCGASDFESTGDNQYTCKECARIIEFTDNRPAYKDTERVNMGPKFMYVRDSHFEKAMEQHQGKQNDIIPVTVYDTIKEEMKKHGLTLKTVKKRHVYKFLEENDYSKYYADVHLIYSELTGESCDEYSHLEEILRRWNRQLDDADIQVRDPSIRNAMNVNFKLMKLLSRAGYKVKKQDMFFLHTVSKYEDAEERYRKAANHLGWK